MFIIKDLIVIPIIISYIAVEYIFSFIFLIICVPLAIAAKSMAPWVPTKKKDIERFLTVLELQKWDKFLEIWCWDARVARAVAEKFPSIDVRGIELAFPIYFLARLKNISWPKNLSILLANAFKQDFWKYDAIYVYGMPDKMWEKIVPKFLREAKSWARLYSYVFSIPKEYDIWVISYGWEGEAKIHVLTKK